MALPHTRISDQSFRTGMQVVPIPDVETYKDRIYGASTHAQISDRSFHAGVTVGRVPVPDVEAFTKIWHFHTHGSRINRFTPTCRCRYQDLPVPAITCCFLLSFSSCWRFRFFREVEDMSQRPGGNPLRLRRRCSHFQTR